MIDHKMKIVFHLMVGHFNWIQDASVKEEIAAAKRTVQHVLKPAKIPGGTKEDNIGKDLKYQLIFHEIGKFWWKSLD